MSIHHNDVSGYRQTVGSSTTQTPAISHTEHVLCNITEDNIDYHEDEKSNQCTLRADATPFTPFPSKKRKTKITTFLQKIASCSLYFPSIKEERHWKPTSLKERQYAISIRHWKPTPLKERKYAISIRIPHDVTEGTFSSYFHEYFTDSGALFNRAFHRCTMQIIDKKHKLFTHTSIDGEEDLFIFNTELHRAGASDDIVYVVGSVLDPSRDDTAHRIEGQFMTFENIKKKYGIHHDHHLPEKLELKPPNSRHYKRDIIKLINTCGVTELRQIKQISLKRSSDEITVTPDELRRSMRNAINIDGNLYPIIFLDKGRQSYSTGMLLRIQLQNEWIGLSFRYRKMGKNKNNKKSLQFAKFCLDNIDIQRKLALYEPCITGEEYPLFSTIAKINITTLKKYRNRTYKP